MFRALLACTLAAASLHAHAVSVENFVLLDHRGDAHELHYYRSAPAVVIMVQGNGCPSLRDAAADFKTLRADYEPRGVKFFMLNSTLQDQRAGIRAEAATLGIEVPILDDETQLVGEALELTSAGEVLVIETGTWEIAYRGPLNERQTDERQRAEASAAYAADALDDVLGGRSVAVARRDPTGCPIDFPHAGRDHSGISYSQTIAPLLEQHCVVCHTEGGLGPWAMSDYTMVLGFAPMIREVLLTKRMPPWHADPHIGAWKNDRSLTTEELQTLVHWIEAGAPRGAGEDPLALARPAAVDWPLGEPDLILEIPAYTVPATGVVDYQFPSVPNPLDEGVWIKAAAVVPGDREVVHHILAGSIDADTPASRRESGIFDNYLIGYAPGNESHTFPADTGIYVPPGGVFAFQMHYTPVGREIVDRSRIGLYFHREQPERFYRQDVVVNPLIRIPPGEARHKEVAYFAFDEPAVLHDLIPHSHYRGVASKFELWKPDGTREVLLSVPNYDFNWQRTYEFVEPRDVPAGSKLVHTTWYDNSAANPGNPDPEREVPWGLQSWDEMLYGGFSYTLVDESTEAPIHDRSLARTAQAVGFLDRNMDGKVSWKELPRPMRKRLVQGFAAIDKNGDGGLDLQEFHVFTQLRDRGDKPGSDSDAR